MILFILYLQESSGVATRHLVLSVYTTFGSHRQTSVKLTQSCLDMFNMIIPTLSNINVFSCVCSLLGTSVLG